MPHRSVPHHLPESWCLTFYLSEVELRITPPRRFWRRLERGYWRSVAKSTGLLQRQLPSASLWEICRSLGTHFLPELSELLGKNQWFPMMLFITFSRLFPHFVTRSSLTSWLLKWATILVHFLGINTIPWFTVHVCWDHNNLGNAWCQT